MEFMMSQRAVDQGDRPLGTALVGAQCPNSRGAASGDKFIFFNWYCSPA